MGRPARWPQGRVMSKLGGRALRGSKWSRVTAEGGVVHHVVRDVHPRSREVTLVTVLASAEHRVSLDELGDKARWPPGWQPCVGRSEPAAKSLPGASSDPSSDR